MDNLRKEFEENIMAKRFMNAIDVYYSNLGGYRYKLDNSPCYYLNGMFDMFRELRK